MKACKSATAFTSFLFFLDEDRTGTHSFAKKNDLFFGKGGVREAGVLLMKGNALNDLPSRVFTWHYRMCYDNKINSHANKRKILIFPAQGFGVWPF
ncbi:hypothetical protein MHI18_01235 [Peribacillus sp. FSL H8-0477]|uniref:hypothetical protein n=1 Tax=Peribacillus sp. FSL H8-0477 TaxID=2921388 RepID=UPI0030F8AE22